MVCHIFLPINVCTEARDFLSSFERFNYKRPYTKIRTFVIEIDCFLKISHCDVTDNFDVTTKQSCENVLHKNSILKTTLFLKMYDSV